MIRLSATAVAAASLAVLSLTGCTAGGGDASPAPTRPQDFCNAMAAAAQTAKPASAALDELFTTIEGMATSASEGDIDNLNVLGTTTAETSQAYADALGLAASLAPAAVEPDVTALQQYWTLYALGLGQVAQTAETYGSLVDQTQALASSDEAKALIAEQPSAQTRVNDAYLSECSG